MEIGNKLKEKRTSAGLSQEALAERIGVTRQTISSWENNRSYPDIGSILKLSDLYDLSLDELLKEDENMRKHVEKTAGMADKVLTVLFVTSVLLLPVSMLLWYWELLALGSTARLISMVLMFVFLFFRLRINAEPWPVWLLAVVAWGALYIPDLILLLSGGAAGAMGVEYIILGVVLLYSRGTVFKTRLAFWETIALYFGIPIFIAVSTMWPTILEQGAFPDPANPFDHRYRIEAVTVRMDGAAVPRLVVLTEDGELFLDRELIGTFEKQPQEEGSDDQVWHLVPDADPTDQYVLTSHSSDGTRLTLEWRSYQPVADVIWCDRLWNVELDRLPTMSRILRGEGMNSTSSPMPWLPNEATWSYEDTVIGGFRVWDREVEDRLSFQTDDESITELHVILEVHRGGEIEVQEYVLDHRKGGEFVLPEFTEDADYLFIRIPWRDGEYLSRLDLK